MKFLLLVFLSNTALAVDVSCPERIDEDKTHILSSSNIYTVGDDKSLDPSQKDSTDTKTAWIPEKGKHYYLLCTYEGTSKTSKVMLPEFRICMTTKTRLPEGKVRYSKIVNCD